MPDNKLNVVIYWHMHQPEYRDLRNGEYHLPWTYLHTIKDYVDMAAHLESCKDAKSVVNFAPVLLEQIDDYSRQLDDFLHHGKALRDPLLSALANPVLPAENEKRLQIIKACLRANKERLVERFSDFKLLFDMAEEVVATPEMLAYYSDQYISDLLVWYHLAWTAENVRLSDPRIKSLMKKAQHFSIHDRHMLVEIIYELISGVIERYKQLAISGRIELSMTPYAHPILPLLLDFNSAKQSLPDATLPFANTYPGGLERSTWHMKKGIETFKHYFGFPPQGCWPSEGSISAETIELISSMGLNWLASGESVLRNSLEKSQLSSHDRVHGLYKFRDENIACFFRDDRLSDSIGFKYSDWHADDAVANFTHVLEIIGERCENNPDTIVSIILDGENAWEYYPENGIYFLSALFKTLSEHEDINLTTYSEYLASSPEYTKIPEIVAGSWVYGTLSTWIGEKDKNYAWDMLVDAKRTYDNVINEGRLTEQELELAEIQLATCESSDWFWWFGETNAAESVATFDEQYRLHLSNLYQLLKEEPPEYLGKAFSFGSGEPVKGGTMLPGQQL